MKLTGLPQGHNWHRKRMSMHRVSTPPTNVAPPLGSHKQAQHSCAPPTKESVKRCVPGLCEASNVHANQTKQTNERTNNPRPHSSSRLSRSKTKLSPRVSRAQLNSHASNMATTVAPEVFSVECANQAIEAFGSSGSFFNALATIAVAFFVR
jgi:hypothetical protein